ncbi:PadR family transcriptional regulator [Ekhidna sp. MALMAid0563]|uniref:PadR family transcriptional regulator n=1 Tax=Ekhidna sp. MALMAid0563 TaxID=3143937 RepID=UPI0032DE58BA
MKGTHLGEFEELVLLAVCTTHPDSYGNTVKDEINHIANRNINLSTAHGALARLEDKGFLSSKMGEATSVRGGKRKRIFEITAQGLKKLEEAKELRTSFWERIPEKVLQTQFVRS